MKTKHLNSVLILVFSLISYFSYAQETECVEGYSFRTYTDKNPNIYIDDILIEWDFTNVENTENISLHIEIQGLGNCPNELDGAKSGELITIKADDLSSNPLGHIRVEHLGINAKCLKWRAVISKDDNSCVINTPWEFKSFL